MSLPDFAAIGERASAVTPGAFSSRDSEPEAPRDIRGMGLPYEQDDGEEAWRTAVSAQDGEVTRQSVGDLGKFAASRSNAGHALEVARQNGAWFESYLRRHPVAAVVAARSRDRARSLADAEAVLDIADQAAERRGTGTGWQEITR